jgi:hypothetical protein
MIEQVVAYKALNGSLHATKEGCVRVSLQCLTVPEDSDWGDMLDSYQVGVLVQKRHQVMQLLSALEEPND